MLELKVFILGILFLQVVSPLLESLVTLIATFIEVLRAKMTVKITKYGYDIQKMSLPEEKPHRAIGFVMDTGEEEEDDEDDL